MLGHVLCRVHPTVAVEDTEGRAELTQPLAVEDAILLAVLLAWLGLGLGLGFGFGMGLGLGLGLGFGMWFGSELG